MGACASVSKQFKGEEGMAPRPEDPKEETAGEVTEVKPQQEEKKPEVVVDDGKVVEDNKPSLGPLLSESDKVKKDTTTDEKVTQTEEKVPSSEPVVKEEPPKAKEEDAEEKEKVEQEKSTVKEVPVDKATQVKEE